MARTKQDAVGEIYMQVSRLNRVIVLEELNFVWDETELRELELMWQKNVSIKSMSKHFDSDPDEILLALIHLAREDRIKRREGGLFGH
jgi:hypothetical protein